MEHTCKLEIALADGTPVIYSFPRTRLRADLAAEVSLPRRRRRAHGRRAENPIPRGLPGARRARVAARRRARAVGVGGGLQHHAEPVRRCQLAAGALLLLLVGALVPPPGSASSPSSSGGASHAAGWAAAALGWAYAGTAAYLVAELASQALAVRASVPTTTAAAHAAGLARAGAPAAARQLALGAVGVGAALLHPYVAALAAPDLLLALPIFARLAAPLARCAPTLAAAAALAAAVVLPAAALAGGAAAACGAGGGGAACAVDALLLALPAAASGGVAARRVVVGGGGGDDAPPHVDPQTGALVDDAGGGGAAAAVGWAALLLLILLVVALLLVQLSVAVLIDALADARERSSAAQADAEHRCFVCGAGRATLQRGHSRGFAHHVRHVHSPLDYFALVLHLRAAPRAPRRVARPPPPRRRRSRRPPAPPSRWRRRRSSTPRRRVGARLRRPR